MTGATNQGPGVFLSYRREDVPAHAGRIYDRLTDRFGDSRVFMDVDSIGLGLDFVDTLERAVASCEVMLVFIGPHWLGVREPHMQRRLDDPSDYVRLEIEAALNRNVRVVPVLVAGASLPDAVVLPESLRPLLRRQALELSDSRFRSDADLLIERLSDVLAADSPHLVPPKRQPSPPLEWSVEPLIESKRRFSLRIVLTHEKHNVLLTYGVWKDQILVDNEVVGSYLSADSQPREFTMSDGGGDRTGVLEVRSQLGGFTAVALTVDGRQVYIWPA